MEREGGGGAPPPGAGNRGPKELVRLLRGPFETGGGRNPVINKHYN